jgi:hypothetical protein
MISLLQAMPEPTTAPVTALSPDSIIMLLVGCLVLYGGFFWCTNIAWKNRHKNASSDKDR